MKHFLYLNWQSAKLALLKILRQPFGSMLTLLMLALALALPLSLYLAVSSVQDWVGRLTATPQITLFMELSAEEADIAAVQTTLCPACRWWKQLSSTPIGPNGCTAWWRWARS
ncbi:hypothetical protein PWG14_12290 (plasmid) [Chromobacterium amazonense]|uniref:hypothetical protein n=1 Tax=Chromobacterium amazonense TaxID=1382803 RepID=UPI00237E70FE|nr:hypothetical protein [Chromobacterium amazonense]MDE1713366.1 hypothetical protein [Chromobacterium amazonense]